LFEQTNINLSFSQNIKNLWPGIDKTVLNKRIRGALWGMFIGDALSMPVHWCYDQSDMKEKYGEIRDYMPAPDTVDNTIMYNHWESNKHSSNDLIGVHINHGKESFWEKMYTHYHQGMKAGENTLNVRVHRVTIRSITSNGGYYQKDRWLNDYIEFMTTPDSHNDTYADAVHRQFFDNLKLKEKSPSDCAGAENHDTAVIAGIATVIPVVCAALYKDNENCEALAKEQLSNLYLSKRLEANLSIYVDLLINLLIGSKNPLELITEAGLNVGVDLAKILALQLPDSEVISQLGLPCYIHYSFPVILYSMYKYIDNFENAILANTNAGGDNCDRGVALGALLGATVGEDCIPDKFKNGLFAYEEIKREIDEFMIAIQK